MNLKEDNTLLVDKPIGWTSFDVVKKIRNALHKQAGKKIKVGHAGTLDPLASGLLIVCTGKKTKQIQTFQNLNKTYTGTFKLGQTTPSFDAETKVNASFPIHHITEVMIKNAANSFIGKQMQMPPAYSAKKVQGKVAYKYARKGENVKLIPAEIEIISFDAEWTKPDIVTFKVKCSKGTYIRSLSFDFGKYLNSGAYLTSLKRESIGQYKLVDACTPEEVTNKLLFEKY